MMQEFRYVILQLCRQTIKVCVIDILNYVKLLPSPLMRPATQNAARLCSGGICVWLFRCLRTRLETVNEKAIHRSPPPSRAGLRYAEAEAPLYSTTTPFWSITFA